VTKLPKPQTDPLAPRIGIDRAQVAAWLRAASPPHAPYAPGDRVRCVVSTIVFFDGLEIRGRLGTVKGTVYDDDPTDPGWVILVMWDRVLPRLVVHHDPGELEPA